MDLSPFPVKEKAALMGKKKEGRKHLGGGKKSVGGLPGQASPFVVKRGLTNVKKSWSNRGGKGKEADPKKQRLVLQVKDRCVKGE